jgi:hypothetical protein
MRELQKDPEYVARMQQRERQQQESTASHRQAMEPLLKELAAKGFRVRSLVELREGGSNYGAAVPVLLQWLPRISDRHAKEDIVRTLSVPWAKPEAAPLLIREFKAANDPTGDGLRWAIANGLAVVADDAVFEDLLHLVQDKQYGKAREMLVVALGNMKDPRAVTVLMNLLDDEQVVGHAVMALGKLKAPAARERLKELMQHTTEWVREEARKAVAAIEPSGIH